MNLPCQRPAAILLAVALLGSLTWQSLPLAAAQTAASPPAARSSGPRVTVRSATLPARGLFDGDQLTAAARLQLDELVLNAADTDVEVAFIAPSGSWQTDSGEAGERSLTPARLQSVRDHLARRGVDARRIYVESRIDPKAKEAQLSVELVGRQAAE